MARYYQTTQRNFQDDFIFQPDMNLALMALQKKDNDIKEQLSTLDLFENLPVDYWKDADQENVKAIKESYANKVADIAASMQGDITNTGASKRAINNLRREIENDYEFGQIRDIQENARTYKEFDAMLKSMPNPADREGYKKMVQNYLDSAQGKGALSSVFKPEELYNSQDYWAGFLNSNNFKALQPDEKASQMTREGGKWLVTEGNQKVELSKSKIGQAFKAYIDGNNLQGYGKSRQNYFGEQWLDEQGNIRMDDNSYLGQIMANGIPSLAYSKNSVSRGLQADPYSMLGAQEAMQIRSENRAEARAVRAAKISNVDLGDESSKRVLNAQLFKAEKETQVQDKLAVFSKALKVPITMGNINQVIDLANKHGSTKIAKELANIVAIQKEGVRASYAPLYSMGASQTFVDNYKKNLKEAVKTGGYQVKGILDYTNLNIPGVGNSTISKNRSLNQIKGDKIGNYDVVDVKIIDDSPTPLFWSEDETKNKIQSSVELTLRDPKSKDGEDITRVAHFYQSSYDLTGTASISKDIINKYSR